jgi:hypothetical protein
LSAAASPLAARFARGCSSADFLLEPCHSLHDVVERRTPSASRIVGLGNFLNFVDRMFIRGIFLKQSLFSIFNVFLVFVFLRIFMVL